MLCVQYFSTSSLPIFHPSLCFFLPPGIDTSDFNKIVASVSSMTGLSANSSVVVEDFDLVGPLKSELVEETDIYLVRTVVIVGMMMMMMEEEEEEDDGGTVTKMTIIA